MGNDQLHFEFSENIALKTSSKILEGTLALSNQTKNQGGKIFPIVISLQKRIPDEE